jgi:hypothetical protein
MSIGDGSFKFDSATSLSGPSSGGASGPGTGLVNIVGLMYDSDPELVLLVVVLSILEDV